MKNEMMTGMYARNGEDVSFNFYTSLSASNKLSFVNSVVDIIVDGDSYNYVIKDMVFDFNIIRFFTDVGTTEVARARNNIDAIEDFLNETNVVEIVKANAALGVIEELADAVELNIEYRTGIHTNSIASSLSSLLNTIEKKVEDIDLDSMMDVAEAMSGISGELTPEKILDAYSKTDIFKRNWENASKDREESTVENGAKQAHISPLALA